MIPYFRRGVDKIPIVCYDGSTNVGVGKFVKQLQHFGEKLMLQVTDATLAKNLDAFIEALATANDVKPNKLSVDDIGDDFICRKLQWNAETQIKEFTLGELAGMLEHDSSICQFEISEAKVKAILFGPDGIAKKKSRSPLFMLPEILSVGGKNEKPTLLIGGGRHRTNGLILLMQDVEGWEELKVNCLVRYCKSLDEAREYIEHSNGSRTMSTTEKTQLDLGISVAQSSKEDLFSEALKISSNFTRAKQMYAFAGAVQLAELRNLKVKGKPQISMISASALGTALVNGLVKAITSCIKDFDSEVKTKQIALLLTTPSEDDGSTYLQLLINALVAWVSENWTILYEHCEVSLRGKRGYNVAMGIKKIAEEAIEYAMSEFSDNLADAYRDYIQVEAETKQAKAAEKQAKAAQAARNQALATIRSLLAMEGTEEMVNRLMEANGFTEADLAVKKPSVRKTKQVAPAQLDELEDDELELEEDEADFDGEYEE